MAWESECMANWQNASKKKYHKAISEGMRYIATCIDIWEHVVLMVPRRVQCLLGQISPNNLTGIFCLPDHLQAAHNVCKLRAVYTTCTLNCKAHQKD